MWSQMLLPRATPRPSSPDHPAFSSYFLQSNRCCVWSSTFPFLQLVARFVVPVVVVLFPRLSWIPFFCFSFTIPFGTDIYRHFTCEWLMLETKWYLTTTYSFTGKATILHLLGIDT